MATIEEFECEKCDRVFPTEAGVRLHTARKHKGMGPGGRPSTALVPLKPPKPARSRKQTFTASEEWVVIVDNRGRRWIAELIDK
jgi:hypothetical protein